MKLTDNIFIDQGKSFSLTIEVGDTTGKSYHGYIRKHIQDTLPVAMVSTVNTTLVVFSMTSTVTNSLLTKLTPKTWIYELIETTTASGAKRTIRSGNAIIEPGMTSA